MQITRFLRNPKVSVGLERVAFDRFPSKWNAQRQQISEAVHPILSNEFDKTRYTLMTEAAFSQTAKRVSGRHIVAIQDTSSLRSDGDQYSIQAHPTIATDAESGALLGLIHADILVRKGGKRARRKHRSFEDKESRRWLDGAQAAARLVEHGAVHVTVVADRESDIYEAFAYKPDQVDLVVRANHNRNLHDDGHLFDRICELPEVGQFDIDLAAAPGRAARKARMAVRFCPVKIPKPKNRGTAGNNLPGSVALHFVDVVEIDPPQGVAPAHWRLLTSHVVDSFSKAQWIAQLYRQRWMIEEVFRTLKTRGFDIERVNIAEGPFEKLATAAIIGAISVMQLVKARDGSTGRPLNDVFETHEQDVLEVVSKTLEGKTDKQKNPHPKGSLAFASWVCARLGGWTGYYGKPGPIVMLRGLHRLRAIQQGWSIAGNV